MFSDNNNITVTNLTDGAAITSSVAYVATGLQVTLSSTNKVVALSTKTVVGKGKHSRLKYEGQWVSGTGAYMGLHFSDGTNYATFEARSSGQIVSSGGVALPTGILTTNFPTFVLGDTIKIQADIKPDGVGYFKVSKNNEAPFSFGLTGMPLGIVSLVHRSGTATVVIHRLIDVEGVGVVQEGISKLSASTAMSSDDRGGLNAFLAYKETMRRLTPVGLTIPANFFSWFKVYRDTVTGKFFTTADLQPILSEDDPTVSVIYVDPVSGLDTNVGSAALPMQTLYNALLRPVTGGRVWIKAKGGLYDIDKCWQSRLPGAAVLQITSWDGLPIISSMHRAGLVWTLDTGTTWTSTTVDATSTVWDAKTANLTADGDYNRVMAASSLANCRATPGTFYASGTTISVNLADGRQPDSDVRVYEQSLSGTALDYNGQYRVLNGTLYMEDVYFEGGRFAFYAALSDNTAIGTIYAKRCRFKYAADTSPIVYGNFRTLYQEAISAWNGGDGFHYNAIFSSPTPNGIEQDCIGRWNGTTGITGSTGVSNNSSNHGGMTVRVKTAKAPAGYGDYHHAEHRGIHDIYADLTSSQSWHFGITSRDSRNGFANFAAGISTDVIGVPKMWNDNVVSSGAAKDFEANSSLSIIYNANPTSGGVNSGSGTVTTYVP